MVDQLAENHEYKVVRADKFALFTWKGCKLHVEGKCSAYVEENPQMKDYAKYHMELEGDRVS